MQVKIFCIRVEAAFLASDQKEINEFLEGIIFKKSTTKFVEVESPYWSVIIHYEPLESKQQGLLERKTFEDLSDNDRKIYMYLNKWRDEKATSLNAKKFMICHNSELIDLALYKPTNEDELQQIKGFGKHKTARFGTDILAILKGI
jgi:superfamily II DNA helicase RecQ